MEHLYISIAAPDCEQLPSQIVLCERKSDMLGKIFETELKSREISQMRFNMQQKFLISLSNLYGSLVVRTFSGIEQAIKKIS